MKKLYVTLLSLLILFSCCNEGDKIVKTADLSGRLYPTITTQATSLIVVDLQNDDIEGQVAAIGLQGVINRDSGEKIYVKNSRCKDNHGGWKNGVREMAQMGDFWLDAALPDISKSDLLLDMSVPNPGLMALVKKYHERIKGVVIYDMDLVEATIEAATTIAAQTDALIVSPAIYESLKQYDFPVIQDLRGMFKSNIECVDWLVDGYFDGANHDVAFTWSHMTTDFKESWGAANKDYVVANRLFTYFLDIQIPEECHYYEKIVKKYPAGTQIMGWTDELKADKLFADYGYFMVPFISVENLSVMSSFPSAHGTPITPKAYNAKSGDVYIAFLISDGDNLLHTMIYMPYTISQSDYFGKMPITWIINPAIVDLAPRVFNWYENKMNSYGQEMGAMMGDGSPSTERYEGFSFYCSLTKHYLNQAGMLTMKQMLDGEAVAWNVGPYCIQGGYSGGNDWRGIGTYEYHMDNGCFHIGTTNPKPEYLDKILDEAPCNEPLFLSVMIGQAHFDVLKYAEELRNRIESRQDGKNYVFVRTADLAATYRAYNSEKTNY